MAPTSLPADKEYGESFLDAYESGDLSQVHDAITSGRLTPYYRNEGLVLSVARGIQPGYVEVVAALLAGGASITPWTTAWIRMRRKVPTSSVLIVRLKLVVNLFSGLSTTPRVLENSSPEGPIQTPLARVGKLLLWFYALQKANVAMAEVLVEYGARLEPNFLFSTMLLRWRGQYTGIRELMTKFLLDEGVNPNQAVSEEWGTPLHLAVFLANADIVKMLLDEGADRTAISVGRKYPDLTPEQLVLAMNNGEDLSDEWLSIMGLLQS
ncbi:hypothetical protein BKA64DRAFT_637924 [Cadophora sp. MPI-SDFR-AT-0126]|nr:hypothetical protein BKA64DRAFT_637924 [Leotiomycetes sp. MPI-SDFR-AT-0126]